MKQKILVIDDTQSDLMPLEEVFAGLGYEFFLSKYGQISFGSIVQIKPDLALFNISSHSLDPFLLLEKLRSIDGFRELPVIFLNSFGDDKVKIKAFEGGAVDVISKPFSQDEIVAKVKNHLELTRIAKSLDFLLKMAAHEFIIPLSVIDTSLQIQKMEYENTRYLDSIASASTTLQGVYKNMAYFLSSHKSDSAPKQINLSEFIKARALYLKVLASAYDCSFNLEDMDDGLTIFWVESELERVVDNLLSNSAKHSFGDSEVKLRVYKSDKKVYFETENRCRRIENTVKLFEEFYKGSKEGEGLGLGLYIALKICENNKASIRVESVDESIFFKICFGEQE